METRRLIRVVDGLLLAGLWAFAVEHRCSTASDLLTLPRAQSDTGENPANASVSGWWTHLLLLVNFPLPSVSTIKNEPKRVQKHHTCSQVFNGVLRMVLLLLHLGQVI